MKDYEIRIHMENGTKHKIICKNTTLTDAYTKIVSANDGWVEYAQEEKVLYVNKEKISSFEVVDVIYEEQQIKEKKEKKHEAISNMRF